MNKYYRLTVALASFGAVTAAFIGYSVARVHAYELTATSLLNDSNLKAYYQFESDGTDTKGNHNLTLNGNPMFTPGEYGNAINLGASNTSTYANIASNLGVSGSGPVAISAWVKLASEPTLGNAVVVANLGVAANFVEYQIEYYYTPGGTKQVRFRRVKQNVAENNTTYDIVLGTTQWHHLVLVHDGTNMWGFIDGNKTSSTSATGNGSSNVNDHFDVGRESQNGTQYGELSGVIDDVAVFNRALSDDEVNTLYSSDSIKLAALRTSDSSVTSNTTPQSDSQLTLSLAHKTYTIDGVIFAKSANADPGIKFDFSSTSASSLAIGYIAVSDSIQRGGVLTSSGGTATVPTGANSAIPIRISGTVTMSHAGNFVFQWAQNISSSDAMTVMNGSYLRATEVQ